MNTTTTTATTVDAAAFTIDAADKITAALVKHLRAEVKGRVKYDAYVAAHGVTAETVKVHAAALANLAFPSKAEQVQKIDGIRTDYGNAVQAAGNGMRRALKALDAATDAPDTDGDGTGTDETETDETGTETKNVLSAHGRKVIAALLADGKEADVMAMIKAEVAALATA